MCHSFAAYQLIRIVYCIMFNCVIIISISCYKGNVYNIITSVHIKMLEMYSFGTLIEIKIKHILSSWNSFSALRYLLVNSSLIDDDHGDNDDPYMMMIVMMMMLLMMIMLLLMIKMMLE